MIKYVLVNRNASLHDSKDKPSEIVDKLHLYESQGISLDDINVTIIDTENFPPKTQTAKSFLKSVGEDVGSREKRSPDK